MTHSVRQHEVTHAVPGVTDETPLLCANRYIMKHFSWCSCRKRLSNRKVSVDFLAVLFGVAAWIAVNGMFVQLPLLVQTQPEEWSLPSFLSVIVQIGNIGPLLYSIARKALPNLVNDRLVIYTILTLGCLALLLMSFFYNVTAVVFNNNHSICLFILSFFLSLVGCTSSVLFMPYMSNFRDIYLISYFVGEGLSGVLPSIIALVQGVGGNSICVNETISECDNCTSMQMLVPQIPSPEFSTQTYFLILFAILTMSTVSFFLLNNLKICESEKVTAIYIAQKRRTYSGNNPNESKEAGASHSDNISLHESFEAPRNTDAPENSAGINDRLNPSPTMPFSRMYLLCLASWVCFLGNGVFPSIQSFSCLPYGNVAYHLSVTLASMANPLACFVASFVPYNSVKYISILTLLSTGVSFYIGVTAFLSPEPPFLDSMLGEILVVVAWIVFTGLISYVKVSIAAVFRQDSHQALFWCGAAQQIGSAVGAVIIFILVNVAYMFESYNPCADTT